jgi:hypothetical protein
VGTDGREDKENKRGSPERTQQEPAGMEYAVASAGTRKKRHTEFEKKKTAAFGVRRLGEKKPIDRVGFENQIQNTNER